jgi:SAM-dependent methyltransferase
MNAPAEPIIALYERHAHAWDRDRGRVLGVEKRWLDRFTAVLPQGASVLDLGCGSGEPIARSLIESGFDVAGADASPTLIALCRDRFPGREWLVADMRSLSLGRRFQGLIAWDSFFHLPHEDKRRMFPIFRDHLALGAALLFTSGPSHGEAIGRYQGEPLYHASLAEAEYRSRLDANGFEVIRHVVEDPDCGHHTVWLAQRQR